MAQRYFVDTLPGPGSYRLGDELAHHLGTVLRARPGDELVLADGRGGSALARVLLADRRRVEVEVDAAVHRPRPPRAVHLAVALPRSTRAEWLFEHATEVGVAAFWPLWTTRARPQGERAERWQKLVRAAAGQCGRDWLPELRPALELGDFLAHPELPRHRLLADAAGTAPPAAGDAVLLVGPEGGFAPTELAAARAAGFVAVRLGPHVLRTETAALVGAALLLQW